MACPSGASRARRAATPASPSAETTALWRTGGADGTIHVWHWADAHKLAALRRHGDSVNRVLFISDGSLLTASESTVAVFRCTTCGSFDDLLKIARDRVTAQQR